MIYLDYSATTPVNEEVLDSFVKACKKYPGNPNSLHKLGVEANHLIDMATKQIEKLLDINDYEIIYTSGSSEANNLALKGVADKYKNRGKHIITTKLEHSSIYGPLNYLIDKGYEVSYVNLDNNGHIDLEHLQRLIRDDTILVTINAVNSELGILQPIDKIGQLLKKYPKCYFHVDLTQVIGKVRIPLNNIDLASFSAHKFYGLKGIGALIKKKKTVIEPLIHGGKSTTIYRSGTPSLPLIISFAKALRLAYIDIDNKYKYVQELSDDLRAFLIKYDKVKINSPIDSIPHILNISIIGVKPESMLHALELYDVFISTQSACATANSISKAVYSITNNQELAKSSIRISLSYLTTKEEVCMFKEIFDKCYKELTCLR